MVFIRKFVEYDEHRTRSLLDQIAAREGRSQKETVLEAQVAHPVHPSRTLDLLVPGRLNLAMKILLKSTLTMHF
ncbi:unnamed protein product [Cylicostephanus goldi]|uniref:Uncharacterized protein n=1 Tax=Cylicostephanus goldi TaxID=71465 RepID=A0A3P7N1R3_CYLGO|nr:unnamed protein product [Cylicostephanus goldi]